jgi:glycosyltransferase involved in cell wall biosynthesis
MRILHWTPVYRPYIGGMEVFISGLVPALGERGHEVRVITGHGYMDLPDHEQLDGVTIDRFPFRTVLTERNPREMLRISQAVTEIHRDFAPDIVHLHFADASLFFYLRTLEAHRCPALITFHVHAPASVKTHKGALWACMQEVDWITACSNDTLERVLEVDPALRSKAAVLRYGLPVPPETAPPSFEPPVIAAAARLVEEKGFDVLIDAVPLMRERLPGLRVRIAGDGPELGPLRAQAKRLGVEDCVEFLGWVAPDEIHGLYESATVVSVPSRWQEPFGLVAVQAAFAGRPAVVSAVGGLPEAAGDEGAVLVEPDDPGALAAAAAEVMLDPERARRMGRIARERAVREFAFDICVDSHERLYEEMTG